ncbi:hypothetical protein SDC9_68032 [bioreactor metagenome]|uniref:Uncharacterized protein n=1 Tax=bioreactor metagenome TaxID=1076179 RepID=A0A644Y0N1_9ZZZZ
MFGTGRNARIVRVAEVGHVAVEQRVQPQFPRVINGRNANAQQEQLLLRKACKPSNGDVQRPGNSVLPVLPLGNARGKVQSPRHLLCGIAPGRGKLPPRPDFYALCVRQVDQHLFAVWKSIQTLAIADFFLLVESVDIRPANGTHAALYAFFQAAPYAEVAVCAVEQRFVARQRFVAVPFCCKLQFVQTRILLDQAGTQSGKDIFFNLRIQSCALSAQNYSFTAPETMPDTICFWNSSTIISVGITTTTVAAVISPQRIENCVLSALIATGTV